MNFSDVGRLAMVGALTMLGLGLSVPVQANDTQAIVITFKQDLLVATPQGQNLPIKDSAAVEAACVATTLARNLQMAANGGSGQSVAMFPALAGVKLANESYLKRTRAGAEACFDPDEGTDGYYSKEFKIKVPDDYTLLSDLVRQFLAAEGRMVVCPLCWISRGYAPSALFDGAEIGTPETVGPLFLGAQKVIDF